MGILSEDYRFLVRLLLEKSGIDLGEGKEYLLENRLGAVVAKHRCGSLAELARLLRSAPADALLIQDFIESMTTHESLFFRDGAPYERLAQDLLPELLARKPGPRQLRIWSAACSTGQEPYSIAMSLLCALRPGDASLEILATDISGPAIARAREGVYSQFEVTRGLTPECLKRYFVRHRDGWQIHPRVKELVSFRQVNLIEPLPNLGRFDVIFCRNVLIYFNVDTKRKVLEGLCGALCEGGYLFLGGAESPLGLSDVLQRVPGSTASIYRKVTA